MLQLPLSGIKKIEAIAQSSPEYISLSQGAMRTGGIPTEIKNYLKSVLNTDKTDYYQSAWGILPLRETIAQFLSKEHKTNLASEQILVTHGAIGALSTIFLTLLDKDDEVLIPEPTYPAYFKLTELAKAKAVTVSLASKCNKNNIFWEFDIEKIKEAITPKTKILVFSNPGNPLGITLPKKDIIELLNICEKNNIYLIVDEAYRDFSLDNNFQSVVDLVNKSNNLIQVASFSKSMAMSGWRVGYMVVPQNLSNYLGTVQDAILNCPNIPAQYAAMYGLQNPEIIKSFNKIINENFEITKNILDPLVSKNIFNYQKPTGAFYLFLKTEYEDAENLCMSILNKAKVTMVPGKYFGPSGKPFIRLCFARDKEVLINGLNNIVNYFLK